MSKTTTLHRFSCLVDTDDPMTPDDWEDQLFRYVEETILPLVESRFDFVISVV